MPYFRFNGVDYGADDSILDWRGVTVDDHIPGILTLIISGGGGGSIAVKDEGVVLTAGAISLNFTGTGVTATDTGSGAINVQCDQLTTEQVQDIVGAFLADGTGIDVVYNDAGNAETVNVSGLTSSLLSDFNEAVDDRVAALLQAGTNVTLSYNDATNQLTINSTGGGGGGSMDVADEGTTVQAASNKVNFQGTYVTATSNGTGGANVTVLNPDAAGVSFTPTGSISSTDVQDAIAELDNDNTSRPTLASSDTSVMNITTATGPPAVTTIDVSKLVDKTTAQTVVNKTQKGMVWTTSAVPTIWPTIKHENDATNLNDGTHQTNILEVYGSLSAAANIAIFGQPGAASAPTQTLSGNVLGRITFRGYDGTAWSTDRGATIFAAAAENVTAGARGTQFGLSVTPVGTTTLTEGMRITADALPNVIIRNGTTLGSGSSMSSPATGYILEAKSSSGGIGYGVGAGGSVTQATSKTTGVTLSRPAGQITMNAAALAADTGVAFVLTNTVIAANDHVIVTHVSAGTLGAYNCVATPAAGSATITVRNVTPGSLSEAIVLKFSVIKGAIT